MRALRANMCDPAFMEKIIRALPKLREEDGFQDDEELNRILTNAFIETEASNLSSNAELRALNKRRMIRAGILSARLKSGRDCFYIQRALEGTEHEKEWPASTEKSLKESVAVGMEYMKFEYGNDWIYASDALEQNDKISRHIVGTDGGPSDPTVAGEEEEPKLKRMKYDPRSLFDDTDEDSEDLPNPGEGNSGVMVKQAQINDTDDNGEELPILDVKTVKSPSEPNVFNPGDSNNKATVKKVQSNDRGDEDDILLNPNDSIDEGMAKLVQIDDSDEDGDGSNDGSESGLEVADFGETDNTEKDEKESMDGRGTNEEGTKEDELEGPTNGGIERSSSEQELDEINDTDDNGEELLILDVRTVKCSTEPNVFNSVDSNNKKMRAKQVQIDDSDEDGDGCNDGSGLGSEATDFVQTDITWGEREEEEKESSVKTGTNEEGMEGMERSTSEQELDEINGGLQSADERGETFLICHSYKKEENLYNRLVKYGRIVNINNEDGSELADLNNIPGTVVVEFEKRPNSNKRMIKNRRSRN